MNITPEQTSELLRGRRSVFPASYSDQPVPKEIIDEMLENANWAPTHKMTEPWRFIVYTGEGIKKLAQFQAELYKELSTQNDSFEEKQYNKMLKKPLMCSHIIAIGMKRNERIPEMEEIAATACAVQNMHLTAAAYGVGAYWSTGGVTYTDEAKSFFGLGKEDKMMGFFYMGMIQEGHKMQTGRRGAIEEKVQWVQ